MDKGEIAEIGTHQELYNQKGLYFDMYNRQQNSENDNN